LNLLLDRGSPVSKLRLNILMRDVGARILQRLAHLGAKPGVIGFLIRYQL